MLKVALIYIIEILFGLFLLSQGVEYFLMYFFIVFLVVSYRQTDCLRKLIRVFQISNEVKLKSIMHKLEISDEDVKNIYDSGVEGLSADELKKLEKDFEDMANI